MSETDRCHCELCRGEIEHNVSAWHGRWVDAIQDRDEAETLAATRYDCHGGPGTTDACGACVSCVLRREEAATLSVAAQDIRIKGLLARLDAALELLRDVAVALRGDADGNERAMLDALPREITELRGNSDLSDDMIGAASKIIREMSICESCGAGDPLWAEEDEPSHLLHGYGEDIGECEDAHIQDAVQAGIIPVTILKRSPCGHEWYGDNCVECPTPSET